MKIRFYAVIMFITLLGGVSTAVAEDDAMTGWVKADVVYIGTNAYPPQHVDAAQANGLTIATYNLDAQRNLEKQLVEGLPNGLDDFDEAERIAGERFDALSTEEVQAIFRPMVLVAMWDIRKVPAIVFDDGGAVIYGLTDVSAALDHWQAWEEGESQ